MDEVISLKLSRSICECRKSDLVKEGMRKVHKDLVDKGFMVKLENMEKYKQDQW